MGKTAIVLGATGVVGSALSRKLIQDDAYDKLVLLGRSSAGFEHPKVEEHLVDLTDPATYLPNYFGDVVFCCVGTTQSKTPDKEKYRAIDYGIPVQAASSAKENGIDTFIVISALGADADSRIFYNRVKGEMEEEVLQVGLPETYLVQPSLIDSDREETRWGERIAIVGMRLLNPLLFGPLKKYRSISEETIAHAMIVLAKEGFKQPRVSSDQLQKLVDRD
ncbi:NAD(P)H-binding protein [Croceiramulus getboli]|nr:NAD(P)H-binding protein [Flavobacteriaceae bacterium YJPT1-3]